MYDDELEPLEPDYTPLEPSKDLSRYDGFYETGTIVPPKRYGGLITALLLLFVFFGSVMGGMVVNLLLPPQEAPEEPTETSPFLPLPEASMAGQQLDPQRVLAQGSVGERLHISSAPQDALSLQEIYRKVSPCVVSITATGSDSAFGSGIIMSRSGYIITNCHVVNGASELLVTLEDGRELPAELVGKDNLSDLAVLRVDAPGLTAAEFGNSDEVQVGDSVTAIGDPLGIELRGTMTPGIVSAINRDLTIQGRSLTLIQTTAALNEGNSGGPLINSYGQVIGINTARIGDYYSSAGVEGLGFAIPINLAKELVEQLISLGYVPGRPSLGVETTVLSYEYQSWFGLPEGLYITEVEEDSQAWELGLRSGDLILYVGETRVASEADLNSALSACSPGDTVSIVIYRNRHQYQGFLVLQDAGS